MIIIIKVNEIEHVNPPPGPTKADLRYRQRGSGFLEGTATLRLIGRCTLQTGVFCARDVLSFSHDR